MARQKGVEAGPHAEVKAPRARLRVVRCGHGGAEPHRQSRVVWDVLGVLLPIIWSANWLARALDDVQPESAFDTKRNNAMPLPRRCRTPCTTLVSW
jgi:hypothetical protein